MNQEGVCRTAPATPGLLTTRIKFKTTELREEKNWVAIYNMIYILIKVIDYLYDKSKFNIYIISQDQPTKLIYLYLKLFNKYMQQIAKAAFII